MKIKRVFHPYDKWEEVAFGMYKSVDSRLQKPMLIKQAVGLLSSPAELEKQMQRTVDEWPISTEQNMTIPGRNKQAWLGQAACCIYARVPEEVTKEAWSLLTDEQRIQANNVADKVYERWRTKYAKNI